RSASQWTQSVPGCIPTQSVGTISRVMKIQLPDFHYSRHDISVSDTSYLFTKVNFTSFDNRASKCFMSFTNIST
ncbi:hypothetical protein, partial [Pseudomonas sp. Sample_16]|uniref:hypothetical protein n=1 Tax=Pseudomonas sp. Sample_16 TaxID=2448263 RepID=UPI0019D5560B